MTYFEIVKKHIDKADFMGFLEMSAPSNEYDIESKMITSKITEQSNANDIASIIAEAFYEMLGKREEASFYLPIAFAIWLDIHPLPSFEDERKEITDMFNEWNIDCCEMSRVEISDFQNSWLQKYTSDGCNPDQIDHDCLPLLWHMFSFEFNTDYIESEPASKAFDSIDKSQCFIYIITPYNHRIAFRLKNANALTSKRLIDLINYDITITASDFSWTYSKTHEQECKIGPYFATSGDNQQQFT